MKTRVTWSLLLGVWLGVAAFAAEDGTVKAPENPPIEGTWAPTFEDNFDGEGLDATKWKVGQHWAGINGGAQPHAANMAVEKGMLVFTWDKKKEPFTFGDKTTSYGTGEVTTYKRFHQAFGYIETRMKYDVQRGLWPAVWTMPVLRATDKPNDMKWAYLKFDLAKAEKPAAKALLKLKVKAAPASFWFDVHRCFDDAWTQAAITWKTKPNFDAIYLAQVKTKAAPGSWVEADVTSFVNTQIAGDKKASFMVADMLQSCKAVSFFSSEADEADRPRLVLDGAEVLASEDAVVSGAKPDENFGAEKELPIFDSYGYIVSTFEKGMEIDILEVLGIWGPAKVSHALHWNGYEKQHKSTGQQVTVEGADLNKWTTVSLYWEEGKVEFYINGKMTWSYANERVCSAPSYLLLSGQTGGWDKNGDNFAANLDPNLPKKMYFDYVKMWSGKKKESAPLPEKEK
ncbi:MAG: DNRLRE domain-containing protein [Planctomycetota bacterium]|nr:DNRLRE domain-containing protein [Planctomycetota bacterium]